MTRGGYRATQDSISVTAAGAPAPLLITLDPAALTSIREIGHVSTTSPTQYAYGYAPPRIPAPLPTV